MPKQNLINLNDWAGLSAPLKRLIEVLQRGVGRIFKSQYTRKDADADAHRISAISAAISLAEQKHGIKANYSRDGITIEKLHTPEPTLSDHLSLEERGQARISHIERIRQINLEQIISHAIMHLQEHDSVPKNRPTDDWIMRYFLTAPDVCSNQMQDLWGRLLAGEILSPGSFSLQLIGVIRNLNPEDAILIERIQPFTALCEDDLFIPYPESVYIKKTHKIKFKDFITLGELGIVFPSMLELSLFDDEESQTKVTLKFNDVDLIVERDSVSKRIGMPIAKFSRCGKELIKLCTPYSNLEFVDIVANEIIRQGATVCKG